MAIDRTGKNALSAGLLLFRRKPQLQLFLAHPGGPFWAKKDEGAWTIPKGLIEEGEDPLQAACREFEEETGIAPREPFLDLGSIRQKAGKTIRAWAWEGDINPAHVKSNSFPFEWPYGSGRWTMVPEIDRCEWFDPEDAKRKLNPAQAEFVDRLENAFK